MKHFIEMLAVLLGAVVARSLTQQRPVASSGAKRCPACGYSVKDIMRHGKFGCATCFDCHQLLTEYLVPGSQANQRRHVGKRPKNVAS